MFAVCDLKVTSVLLLVLEAAQARMGLGMEDIHWENFLQGDREWIRGARRSVRPECRWGPVKERGKESWADTVLRKFQPG